MKKGALRVTGSINTEGFDGLWCRKEIGNLNVLVSMFGICGMNFVHVVE